MGPMPVTGTRVGELLFYSMAGARSVTISGSSGLFELWSGRVLTPHGVGLYRCQGARLGWGRY